MPEFPDVESSLEAPRLGQVPTGAGAHVTGLRVRRRNTEPLLDSTRIPTVADIRTASGVAIRIFHLRHKLKEIADGADRFHPARFGHGRDAATTALQDAQH